jgi:23S rRNA (uracil1939-C5)-methyltransferase
MAANEGRRAHRRQRRNVRPSPTEGGVAGTAVETFELEVERTVAGGAGLGREPGGRVVLVDGALPGERVEVRLTSSKERMATADTVAVLQPSSGRITPPCAELAAGCGGCDMQHADPALQRQLKVGIVRDALARIGRLPDVEVSEGEHLGDRGFRTVLRCGVIDARAGLRSRRSWSLRPLDGCMVAHPLVEDLLVRARFPGAEQVTIRVGARTGERMVVVDGGTDLEVPDDVTAVRNGVCVSDPWIHEVVAGQRFRISADSFFQARPDGAEALLNAVHRSLEGIEEGERLADLYGGVGLFSAGLSSGGGVLVERSPSAIADALVNLDGRDVTVVEADVRKWEPESCDVAVADPARAGLGADGVAVLVGTGAGRIALVSCDPASLARDARLLVEAGYVPTGVELVDMFPHTHHVEAVTGFRRPA